MDTVTLTQSLGGLNDFFLHFLAAIVLVVVFSMLYVRITPYPEFKLILAGKVAPAVSFSGALLGFVIPLAGAISQSVSFIDMLVWAVVAFITQIAVFLLLRAFCGTLCSAIADDQLAPAMLLGVLSLSAGILNAACMTY